MVEFEKEKVNFHFASQASVYKGNDVMRMWVIFGVFFLGLWAYGDYSKQQKREKYLAREAACQANLICRNEKYNQNAKLKSMISSSPVESLSGVVYFKGDECTGDCSGHIAGYQWAEEKGISEDEDCTGYSDSFIDGCLQYVAEREAELEEDNDQYDDSESCTPGRYGDC